MTPCRECQHEVSENAPICPNCGAPRPANPNWNGWGWEYKSKAAIGNLPLLHISFKYRPNRLPVVARGVIAIGQFAAGAVTIAQVGVGIVSVSQLAVGVWAIGQFAVASSLIAQIGIYFQSGRGQVVKSFSEVIQWLLANA
ncbi:MAG TPA: zinc ribbon domain-containing protein [Candidatus Hydrogenedentes bacterium]|nr:zinc ribbon domain-containing protein [Candidatus Hydrogenedentota bacterium]